MNQGDIYIAQLDPTKGNEQKGTRPVVIISGNTMNEHFGIVICCPISSSIKHYAGCVFLKKTHKNGLDTDSEIISFQVRSLSKSRLVKKIGCLSYSELKELLEGLNDILTY